MIKTLTLNGFRAFDKFEVHGLGRINLLGGTNNCGKTSILEAVQIYASSGDPTAIWQIASRRGERLSDLSDPRNVYTPEVDICHLFHGHEIGIGSEFKIVAQTDNNEQSFQATIVEGSTQRELFDENSLSGTDDIADEPNRAIELEWTNDSESTRSLTLSDRGGISRDVIRRQSRFRQDSPERVSFISTAGLTIDDVVGMFERIVLTPEEDLVTRALQTIDPSIDRIATLSGDSRRSRPGERGGIVVKCVDSSQRVPIGSMGDGMWRMLGLALAIASCENGILLVDEIDTGLHFTVMENVWKLIDDASRRLNVQVFATTHSRDAYESLAAISHLLAANKSQVTIQRIDRSKSKSVMFSEREIIASAEHGTEVR